MYTMFFVILGWVLFRADNLTQAYQYITAMFGSSGIWIDNNALFFLKENFVYFIVAILASTPVIKHLTEKSEKSGIAAFFLIILFLLILLCSVAYIVKGTYNPFIYFNF